MDVVTLANPKNCPPFIVYSIVTILFILVTIIIYYFKYNTWSLVSVSVCNSLSCMMCSVFLLSLCTIPVGEAVSWFLVILSIMCMFTIIIGNITHDSM